MIESFVNLWHKWKAWGDAWIGGWFGPRPITEIEGVSTRGLRRPGGADAHRMG